VSPEKMYPKSVERLKGIFGDNYKEIEPYLHMYDGESRTIKPVAKHITIYWVGRATDFMVLRTEGQDDIVLTQVGGEAVPTIMFRKLKAVYLREYMQIVRIGWERHRDSIAPVLSNSERYRDYDFLGACSLAVGIAGGGGGVIHGRCMKCPVDVLMGATSAEVVYNLHGRFMGDSAYALTPSFTRRTGTAVDEVTSTTIMLTGRGEDKGKRTGALFAETQVDPGTIFVGKVVLPMVSPPELVYVLWLLTRVVRAGARTSIQGTLEVAPVAIIGDLFEVGTAYGAAERLQGKQSLDEAKNGLVKYIEEEAGRRPIEITAEMLKSMRSLDILEKELVVELWVNTRNFIEGMEKYIRKQ